MKVKVMGSNLGYLLKSSLLYLHSLGSSFVLVFLGYLIVTILIRIIFSLQVGHSSAIGSGVTFNGASFNEQTNGSTPRTVFVTIHENEVTTKLISNHGSPTSISNLDNLDSIKQTLVTTEIN